MHRSRLKPISAACLLVLTACFVLGSFCAAAPPKGAVVDAMEEHLRKPWKGDLEGMVQRRVIRVLVVYNKTNYFLDGPVKRGFTYEAMTRFEKQLNKKLKTRHLKIHLVFIPVARNDLIPYLEQGIGDIAAANLTITPEREKKVDFCAPVFTKASELIVAGPSAPPIDSLEGLSGQTVYVRKSSSYFESLQALNRKLQSQGKKPVDIEPADERLETEDILEMVNADLVHFTAADNYLADFWKKIFKDIKVYDNLALRSGGRIAWAVRKGSPELKKELNRFVKQVRIGTLLGNILGKRYLQKTKWARKSLAPEDVERFKQTMKFFKKYAAKYKFDWLMVTALAYQESRLDQKMRSPAGAVGVMQLLPSTAAGPPVNIPDIQDLSNNIHAGVKYLHYIYNTYYKNEPMEELPKVMFTFASYNAGPARVQQLRERAKKMGLNPNLWFNNVEVAAAQVIGRETVQYVSNILKYYLGYKQIVRKMETREELKGGLGEKK